MRPGPRNALTDVPGLKVGSAHDARLKSGVTVVTADAPFVAAVHVMGGAPGTRETDLLAPDRLVDQVDAVVLAGGSAFGLDAASGVAEGLRAAGRGFEAGAFRVPIVPAAILFDLPNGGDKTWTENPYRALGAQALASAGEDMALGSAGAGYGALAGGLKGGLGSASLVLPSGMTVAALAAVNAGGRPTVGLTPHFWAAPWEIGDEFGGLGPAPAAVSPEDTLLGKGDAVTGPFGNTTLAVVAVDAALDKAAAQRVAIAAHDGLARALGFAHSPFDGDIVFAVATGARPVGGPRDLLLIGHAAALCLARAVARGVYLAEPAAGDVAPAWRALFARG
ncbi:MAG: peptidase S58 family protein [Rhodobacteraceae bacterium]|nr:MAG: peptidase S58 family protein [Paracoccaceae bacterium]